MFPTRDLIDGFEQLLYRDHVHHLLVGAYPELEERNVVDDASPMLAIPTRHGGAVILCKGERQSITPRRIATPGGEGVSIVEPESIERLPQPVAEKLELPA